MAALLHRAKELPPLDEFMDRVSAAPDAGQSPEEQMNAARRIAASFSRSFREGD